MATGRVGDDTCLDVSTTRDHRRRSRLDTGVLTALVESVERDPTGRAGLRFRASTGLYRAAGALRVIEARTDRGTRSHHLVALDADDALTASIDRARSGVGATVEQLAARSRLTP